MDHDPIRRLVEGLPRPLRFLGVGGLTDLAVFTLVLGHHPHPLLARLVSLAAATAVTWRLNRALTFDRSGRRQADEVMRYAMVAATAQAVSYAALASARLSRRGMSSARRRCASSCRASSRRRFRC